ncbi:MAG: hypothetical protein AAGA27_02085 [Pseudomonadota bacterium]
MKKTGDVIQPTEFANIVLFIYQQPQHITIRDIIAAPTISTI